MRFIGDTGKGKTRILNVTTGISFYPVTASGGSSATGIIRFNEKWHGILKIAEADRTGGMESDLVKYLNLGFEEGDCYIKNSIVDLSKQEFFDPFCPKIIAMRKPFNT